MFLFSFDAEFSGSTEQKSKLTDKQIEYAQSILDNSAAIRADWKDSVTLNVTFEPDKLGKNDHNDNDKFVGNVASESIAKKGYEYTGQAICVRVIYPDGKFVSKTCVGTD